jgi:hypothetical protein
MSTALRRSSWNPTARAAAVMSVALLLTTIAAASAQQVGTSTGGPKHSHGQSVPFEGISAFREARWPMSWMYPPPLGGSAMSANGRLVVFTGVDGNVYLRDRRRDDLAVVARPRAGHDEFYDPRILDLSADGRFVLYASRGLLRKNLRTGAVRRIDVSTEGTAGDGRVLDAAISSDGHLVAFVSDASNLVRRDTNDYSDVFVRNVRSRRTRLVSVATDGEQDPRSHAQTVRITSAGRFVAFSSTAELFPTDTDGGLLDVYVHDRRSASTRLVSVHPPDDPPNGGYENYLGAVSGDGRFLAYSAIRNGRGDLTCSTAYVSDQQTDTIRQVAPPCVLHRNWSWVSAMSGDGRFLLLTSTAEFRASEKGETDAGASGDPDVFIRDRLTGRTVRVSKPVPEGDGPGASYAPSVGDDLTPDGRLMTFTSLVDFLPEQSSEGAAVYLSEISLSSRR